MSSEITSLLSTLSQQIYEHKNSVKAGAKTDLSSVDDPTLGKRLAETDDVDNLTEILQSSQFAALKSSDPKEAKSQSALKMNVLAKLIKLPDELMVAMPGNTVMKGTSENSLQKIKDLQKKYDQEKIPLVDPYFSAVKNNSIVKVLGLMALPLTPFTFLAMSGARTPAENVQKEISFIQRTVVNSMVETGQLKNIVQQTRDQLDLLNGLALKTIINEASSKSEAAPKMRLLLNYLMSPREKMEMASGQLSEEKLNVALDDPKNNRIVAAKEKLNELTAYLSGDSSKIIEDIPKGSENSNNLKTFVRELLGGGELFLDAKFEGDKREIDPFFNKIGLSDKQVTALSEKFEKALAELGIIFKKTGAEIKQAYETKDKAEKLANANFVKSVAASVQSVADAPEFKQVLDSTKEITGAVSSAPVTDLLGELGNNLGVRVKDSKADSN